ncbi:MAG: 1-acyl-sn-glycerol-3-phosphate acyltransferase [Treponema sp.]|nr:1-acyl-sn-glycerol-3-phosphate acyltransferase [Treponema sp.]
MKHKKASSLFFWILRRIFGPALYLLYRFRFEKSSSKGIKRPCFILANHQTGFDQFAVGLGFSFGINYVASDTIFRHGLLSWLMAVLTRPIPFSKGNSDFVAIKSMMSVIRDGGCVGMFPSGNRSFFGEECAIVGGVGRLAKKFNVPLVLVQVRGGYNTLARWSAAPNRGKMRACVTRVVQPAELQAMTAAEVDGAILRELRFDEFEHNRKEQTVYRGRRKAEYLESVLFYCPECGGMSGLCSSGSEFFCRDCGARVRINGAGFFEKISKAGKIPDTILEWSRMQLDYVKGFDYSGFAGRPVFCDNGVAFFKAVRASSEELLGKGSIGLFADRLSVCGRDFPFAETTTAIHGVRKMSIYCGEDVYAVEAPVRTNLVKYMICGYHLRNRALNVTEEYYGY